jgi:hypothetical protein
VIEKLESYLLFSVEKDPEVKARESLDELEEAYNLQIFDDARKFDEMSITHVRRHWLKVMGAWDVDREDEFWTEEEEVGQQDGNGEGGKTRKREDDEDEEEKEEEEEDEEEGSLCEKTNFYCCILIDEEVLESILNAPATPQEADKLSIDFFESVGYVKIIGRQSGPEEGDRYPGWMKVDLTCLWSLYDQDDLETQYPYEDAKTGDAFVYTRNPPMNPETWGDGTLGPASLKPLPEF